MRTLRSVNSAVSIKSISSSSSPSLLLLGVASNHYTCSIHIAPLSIYECILNIALNAIYVRHITIGSWHLDFNAVILGVATHIYAFSIYLTPSFIYECILSSTLLAIYVRHITIGSQHHDFDAVNLCELIAPLFYFIVICSHLFFLVLFIFSLLVSTMRMD